MKKTETINRWSPSETKRIREIDRRLQEGNFSQINLVIEKKGQKGWSKASVNDSWQKIIKLADAHHHAAGYDTSFTIKKIPHADAHHVERKTVDAYRYRDPNYSCMQTISPQEAAQIRKAALTLYALTGNFRFKEKNMDKIAEILNVNNNDRHDIIHFDYSEDNTGTEHIEEIVTAIQNKQTIQFTYQKFHDETPQHIQATPYLIRQYNRRWYAITHPHTINHQPFHYPQTNKLRLTPYPLDRITSPVQPADIPYKDLDQLAIETNQLTPADHHNNIHYDIIHDYYADVIGPTVHPVPTQTITLKIHDKQQWKYILTKPIHGSQKIPGGRNNPYSQTNNTITLKLKPNYELKTTIMSYGPKIEVLEPQSLREEIKQIYQRGADIYK